MRKRSKLKSALALLSAAVMALTEPEQSMVYVRAAEEQESVVSESKSEEIGSEQTEMSEAETGEDAKETVTEVDTGVESETNSGESPDVELSSELMDVEETESESSAGEVSADGTVPETEENRTAADEEDNSIVEETAEGDLEDMTQQETAEDETEAQETVVDGKQLSVQEQEDTVVHSVNKKEEFVIKKGEESGQYSFTPEEDGVYALKIDCDGLDLGDYGCNTSGIDKTFPVDDELLYREVFRGKAGDTVYFQPYVSDDVWENDDLTEITMSIEIHKAGKGEVSADDAGKYTLAYNDVKIILTVGAADTIIQFSASVKDKEDSNAYFLSAYCDGLSNDSSRGGWVTSGEKYSDYFMGLDTNTEYHMEYAFFIYDEAGDGEWIPVWFDGSGMPFDLHTKNVGELSINMKEEFVVKKGEESRKYSFTPEEDGMYALKIDCSELEDASYGWDYGCNTEGIDKFFGVDREQQVYKEVFMGKAGETVFFQPYISDDGWYNLTEITMSIEIHKAGKGVVSADDAGKYALSYNDVRLALNVDATNTIIQFSASLKDEEDSNDYYLSVHCTGVAVSYNGSRGGWLSSGNEYSSYFGYLDINTAYHLEYVLFMWDEDSEEYGMAWFDGTGIPFDICTKDVVEDTNVLSVNKKETFEVRMGETGHQYSFTPQEDGVYALKMSFDGFNYGYWYRTSGIDKSFSVDSGPYEEVFMGKAGKTVCFQPQISDYVWEDYGLTQTTMSMEIYKAEKGEIIVDDDGKYALSCNNTQITLDVCAANTSIRFTASSKNTEDADNYYLSIYCTGGGSTCGQLKNGYDYSGFFSELKMNTEYHLEYVLFIPEGLVWFDGTGMPFDITTKYTDKVGGAIYAAADFGSITVEYELFRANAAGYGGYIRYRKSAEEEWKYQNLEDAPAVGSIVIYADSESSYIIELVSKDKSIVYDSTEITTNKYEGSVLAEVREDSITSVSAEIDIKGFDTGIQGFTVRTTYIDNDGKEHTDSRTYGTNEIKTGIVTYQMDDLEAATDYQNVKIQIETETYINSRYDRQLIYVGQISFQTKEASIKEEDISIAVASTGRQTAEIRLEVKEIPSNLRAYVSAEYRCRENVNDDWKNCGSWWFTSADNTRTISLNGLEAENDYELRFRIDGISVVREYHHILECMGNVKPEIKVIDTFVNGLELECALSGADIEDEYTCYLEIYRNGSWVKASPNQITLDAADTVKQKFYSGAVRSGQTQKWRYRIYQNGSEYYVGSFESETRPLELEITSVENSELTSINGTCRIDNWVDVIKYSNIVNNIAVYCQIRRKNQGNGQWSNAGSLNISCKSDGFASFKTRLTDMTLEPRVEYDIRLVSVGDESIVYGQTSFVARCTWNIIYNREFVYNHDTNGGQHISIYGNYEKPTVEVENDSIISVKEIRQSIRQSMICLDIHNMGATKLYVSADGITKEVAVTVTAPVERPLYFLEGADTSLEDIAKGLPENFNWVDGSVSPKADDANKIQYFDAEYKEKNSEGIEETRYASIPVAVGKLGSIEIRGCDTVGAGKYGVYSVYYSSIGVAVNYYTNDNTQITQQWTGTENLLITGSDSERNVTVKGGETAGTYELTLTATVKNILSGNECEVREIKKVRVIGSGLMDNLIILPAEQQPADGISHTAEVGNVTVSGSVVSGTIIAVDYDDYIQDQKCKVQMEAKTDTGNGEQKDAPVSWKTENAGVVEVSDTGLATIKGKGEGQIVVTAEDGGGYSEQVIFKVFDNAPVFADTSLIVRHGDSDGVRLVFNEKEDNPVTGIKVTGSSQLEVMPVIQYWGNIEWHLRTKADSTYSGEKTEQVTLEIATQKKVYNQSFNVTVLPKPKADKATASFKQTVKPNLFYVDSEAVFAVTSSYDIEDIRTNLDDRDKANFHVKNYDTSTGLLTLTANKLSRDNVSEFTKKNSSNAVANVEVKFKGYDGYVAFDNIKVSVKNKAVSIKAENAFVTENSEDAIVNVLSGKNVYDITGATVEKIVSVSPKKQTDGFTEQKVNGGQISFTYKGTGNATYKLELSHPNWTRNINLSGKVSKVDISKLALNASKTKAILNMKYFETVEADFKVKGNDSLPVTLKAECVQTDALDVQVTGNTTVVVSVKNDKTIIPKKYTVKVWGEMDGVRTKTTNLAVTVTDKEPTVKLSSKGSINIANRDLSGITYTAAVKNTDATISKVEIVDVYSLRFSVKKDSDKKFTMKALKGAQNIVKNTKYPVKVRVTFSNGYFQDWTLNVKPVNKLPKITVSEPKKPVVMLNIKNPIRVKLTPEKGYQIEKVMLVNEDDKFNLTMDDQNTFIIRLADNCEVKAKTYTLKYQIYFTGADHLNPLTKSIKVTVNN